MKRFKDAIQWRIAYASRMWMKIKWTIKKYLDFSNKIKVEGISVIVIGRNDNYGGNFSERLRVTLDWNLSHLPNAELIYVEWNQIKDRPSDCEWIVKRYKNAKCYIVSNEIHRKIAAFPEKMPVMEFFAKNIGIRKAINDWILIVNADVFIGNDVVKNIRKLNPKTVYGTHYVTIKWDGAPISKHHQKNKKNIVTAFSAANDLSSVVGNFVLTHKKNWMEATGYDETLTNSRLTDSNGLKQLLHLGLKPMVLGHHYHLDHPESIIHGANETHGNQHFKNIPYKNPDGWGFANYPLKQIGERIWEINE